MLLGYSVRTYSLKMLTNEVEKIVLYLLDFDGDDMLGVSDLRQVVDRLIGSNKLSEMEMQHLIQNILEEADLDDDGALSFAEFEHIIDKSSDFSK